VATGGLPRAPLPATPSAGRAPITMIEIPCPHHCLPSQGPCVSERRSVTWQMSTGRPARAFEPPRAWRAATNTGKLPSSPTRQGVPAAGDRARSKGGLLRHRGSNCPGRKPEPNSLAVSVLKAQATSPARLTPHLHLGLGEGSRSPEHGVRGSIIRV